MATKMENMKGVKIKRDHRGKIVSLVVTFAKVESSRIVDLMDSLIASQIPDTIPPDAIVYNSVAELEESINKKHVYRKL